MAPVGFCRPLSALTGDHHHFSGATTVWGMAESWGLGGLWVWGGDGLYEGGCLELGSRREQRMDTEWALWYICTSERGWTVPAPPCTPSLLPPFCPLL